MRGGLSFVYFSLASKEKYIAVRAKSALSVTTANSLVPSSLYHEVFCRRAKKYEAKKRRELSLSCTAWR